MAITRRPEVQPTPKKKPAQEAEIDRLIRKGGSVPEQEEEKPALVQLRLSRSVLDRIDTTLKSRAVPPSRHTWFLEAIHEKLQREE